MLTLQQYKERNGFAVRPIYSNGTIGGYDLLATYEECVRIVQARMQRAWVIYPLPDDEIERLYKNYVRTKT